MLTKAAPRRAYGDQLLSREGLGLKWGAPSSRWYTCRDPKEAREGHSEE